MPDLAFTCVLAADAPAGGEGGGDGGQGGSPGGGILGSPMMIIVIIFFIFYFLVIRPQSKERKKREEILKQVKKRDKVITTAGIHGTVVTATDTDVVLEVADGVRLKFERSAIWQVKSRAEDGEAPAAGTDAAAEPESPSEATAPGRGKEKGKA